MSDMKRRGAAVVGEPGGVVGGGGAEEVRALACMLCGVLRGTDQWAWLCPLISLMSAVQSVTWLYYTEELPPERKGYVLMGMLFCIYAVITLSKRVRDEQDADLLQMYGQNTRFYHAYSLKRIRGTDKFQFATHMGLTIALIALFGGIWWMPFSTSAKWSIAMMCTQTIGFSFVYANQARNTECAKEFLDHINQAHP